MRPFLGEYKTPKIKSDDEPLDIYSIVALAKRLNITLDDMKQMSFVSLVNILYSTIEDKSDTKKASQKDIDAFLMWGVLWKHF